MRLSPSIALLRTQTDERLVELAREGSEPAFAAIVERYRRPLLRMTSRILPESRAEDAVQQAFIAAWKALRRGDEVRDLRPWLGRIARNTALNALRVPGYDAEELGEAVSGAPAPQEELERREVVLRTLAGLAALPDRQREAILRSAVDGSSHADIARHLGLSEGATRQLVLRARVKLRSAATAIMPLPLMQWIANGAGRADPTTARIAELAAGAGSVGATAVAAKAGVVVVLAGSAVAGPTLVENRASDRAVARDAGAQERAVRASSTRASHNVTIAATPGPATPTSAADTFKSSQPRTRTQKRAAARRRSGEDGHDQSDDSVKSPGRDDGEPGDDRRGSGSSGSGQSGREKSDDADAPEAEKPAKPRDSGSSHSGSDDPPDAPDDSGSSHSGSDDPPKVPSVDDPAPDVPELPEEPDDSGRSDGSGKSRDSSGSGGPGTSLPDDPSDDPSHDESDHKG